MDIQSRKIEFVQQFLKLQNEEVISLFETMLQQTVKPQEEGFNPMTMEEFNARISQSLEDSKKGKLVSAKTLRTKIDKWN